jgi:hypothetical protein
MTLQEAIEIRNKYLKLVGMNSPLFGTEIIDVIVEPLGVGDKFVSRYVELLREFGSTSNDILLSIFEADNYRVVAVLDDGYLTHIAFDDIKEYKTLI